MNHNNYRLLESGKAAVVPLWQIKVTVLVLLMAVITIEWQAQTLKNYINNCEIIGNAQGQVWRECPYGNSSVPTDTNADSWRVK